jgi:hypothetical protein
MYFPCNNFYSENKKKYDGFKIDGKLFLVFAFLGGSKVMGKRKKALKHYNYTTVVSQQA